MRRGWRASAIGVIGFAWGSVWAGVAAADPVEEALAAAREEIEQGRCEQAEARLAAVEGLANRARLLGGQCLIRTGRYPEALASLDQARGARDLTAAQVGDVELFRGVALYHLERYAEASAALEAAEGLTAEPAQLALYRGLITLRGGDDERAAPDLEAAALLSPALTEPVASYYAGLAWQGAGRKDAARTAFERVIALDGEDGAWGRQARELLGAADPHPFALRAMAGLEYDDNVILRGGATQFTAPDSPSATDDGEKDGRAIWSVDGSFQLFEAGDFGAGLTAGYSGNAHFDLADFDTQYPRIGAYALNRLGPETTAQLRYEFGAAWVDEDSFLRTQLAEAGLSHAWPKAGTTVLVADLLWNDLRFPTRNVDDVQAGGGPGDPCAVLDGTGCGPEGLDEGHERDRDGYGLGAAVEHRYTLPILGAASPFLEVVRFGGGYRFRYYDSQGSEWKHMSHVFTAGLELDLPGGFSLANRFGYEFRDFSNPSTFPDREPEDVQYRLSSQDRQEHEVSFSAELAKSLTEDLSISTRWSYLDNESNRRVYDYTRHIVGAYVNVRFD